MLTDGDIVVFGVTQTNIYAFIDKTKKPTDKIEIPNFDDIQDKLDFKLEQTSNDSELQENLRHLTRKGIGQKKNNSSIVGGKFCKLLAKDLKNTLLTLFVFSRTFQIS